jgi:hypothetical protein
MDGRRVGGFSFLVLGAITAFAATAGAAQHWDVPDYSSLSIRCTTAPVVADTALREALAEYFDAIDTDHDGKISVAEAKAALPGLTSAVFKSLDVNGDQFITRDEVAGCDMCDLLSRFGMRNACRAILSAFGLMLFGRLFSGGHGDTTHHYPHF